MSHSESMSRGKGSSPDGTGESGITTFGHADRLAYLKTIVHSICASADVEQTGHDRFSVTAPPEFLPRLVKAWDCASGGACTVDFFERWPQHRTS